MNLLVRCIGGIYIVVVVVGSYIVEDYVVVLEGEFYVMVVIGVCLD